ncbi:hypothetical protein Gogos_019857 [Gossypium gossypioides]|uniref:Uncharacterized protein n=1 Tax=Gossypium gossypioides TaxID=34282 RepID=A0A7J9D417_GOSGO|nr:hypothetical protein [Gossypium gossypioides]
MEGYMSELKVDLVPTVEEYTTLLRCSRIQADKAYSRAANVLTFLKRLMSITGMMLGHIYDAVSDLFDGHDKRVTHVPGRKGLLSSILRELLSVERIRGYAKVR